MSGTFSSLSSALSALRYNRVAMDVASGNVANAGTEGYARRQVIGQATGAPAVPAMWSRWDVAGGDGVQPGGVTRMVDPLLDARSRTEHASLSYHDTRSTSLVRFETTLGEPGDNGVSAALSAFKAGWHDVANNPGDLAARSQLLARAETLAGAVRAQDRAVTTEWGDQRTRLDAQVAEVNQVAKQLADLNVGLRNAHVAGTDAGVLLDQRDQLTLRLAELTGSKTNVKDDSTVEVELAGKLLVSSGTSYDVTVSGNQEMDGTDGPVTIAATGPAATTGVVTPLGGEMGGSYAVLTQDLPGYRAKLDAFATELATKVNAQQASGQGLNNPGVQGVAMFNGATAGTLTVAFDNPDLVAAAKLGAGELDNSNATTMAGLDMGAKSYRELITSFGVTVSTSKQAVANQAIMAAQVDGSREALSGISIDEEMVNLLAAQRGYEGAARVLTEMDSMLDTLINRTGAR
jgi:flagellar hook-associated protein 1 FlgK